MMHCDTQYNTTTDKNINFPLHSSDSFCHSLAQITYTYIHSITHKSTTISKSTAKSKSQSLSYINTNPPSLSYISLLFLIFLFWFSSSHSISSVSAQSCQVTCSAGSYASSNGSCIPCPAGSY